MRFLSRQRRLLIAVLTVPALQLLLGAFLSAQAAEATLDTSDNTLLLISAAMVLLMTPGLAFFYGGFVQGRNVLNTMAMSFVMMGIAPWSGSVLASAWRSLMAAPPRRWWGIPSRLPCLSVCRRSGMAWPFPV